MLGKIHAWTAVAGLCLVGLALPAVAETLDFKFRTPPDAKEWKAVTQKWKVGSKGYTPIFVTPDPFAVSVLEDRTFKNLEASFQLRDVIQESYAGAFIRGTVNGTILSGYVALLVQGENDSGLVGLSRFDALDLTVGVGQTGLCDGIVTYKPKSKITITAKGTKLEVFYNNEFVCSVKDGTYKTGSVGLIARLDSIDVIYRRAKIVTPD